MATAIAAEQGNMRTDINTTPLIDVMLVLLIMFIITIPVQTHSVRVDLPGADGPIPEFDTVKNRIVITGAGQVMWNETPVDLTRLRQYVDATQRMAPVPELQLEPEAMAPYAIVDRVLAVAKRAQVTKMGFVGNEKYVSAF